MQTASPRVSVVTRTRDRALLLDRAIRSVLQQTFDDLEMIVVNDGGDPEPVEGVVGRYESIAQGRIRVIHNAHSTGMEAASNLGLRSSSGTYVTIHDDDDSWHPQFLERSVAELGRTGLRGVVTGVLMIHEEVDRDDIRLVGTSVFETRPESNRDDPVLRAMEAANGTSMIVDCGDELEDRPRTVVPPTSLYRLLESNLFPPIAFLYERSVFDEIGYYDEELPPLADWDFNIRFLMNFDLAFLPQTLAYYHHRRSKQGPMANSVNQANVHNVVRQRILNRYLRCDLDSEQLGSGYLANRLNDDRLHRIAQQSSIDSVWNGVHHAQVRIEAVEHSLATLVESLNSVRVQTFGARHPVVALRGKLPPTLIRSARDLHRSLAELRLRRGNPNGRS